MSHPAVLPNILHAIGNTPMVKLHRMGSEYPCEIYAKCEFMNPGGSVKDRIAYRMVEEAEKEGRIKPGDTLIEATSGNTGIGLAMAAAINGYRLIICMPMKMSQEKQNTMEALGAIIVRTKTELAHDHPDSLFGVARRLQAKIPNSHILDQYANPNNIAAHYYGTGAEIVEQMGGKLDYVIVGAGTGGTVTGIGRRVHEEIPGCVVVAADPEGSILAEGCGEAGEPYRVEGIGYDFIPESLDRSVVDRWIKTNDKVAFELVTQLIRKEGLLAGASSGSAMQATLEIAKEAKPGSRIVVILPDGVRNYMSKFLSKSWREENGMLTSYDLHPTEFKLPAI